MPYPSISEKFVLLAALLSTRRNITLGAAAVAALTIILRHKLFSKDAKLIHDLSKVGFRVDSQGSVDDYDFIIVGGGTAGCVLASRLTENPNIKVLVLEAAAGRCSFLVYRQVLEGVAYPLNTATSIFTTPQPRLYRTRHAFNIHTEPQTHASGRRRYFPRGKMLGGCSSINAQMAQYGSPEDFDEWAKVIGDDSWAWHNFGQYFRKFETCTADSQYPEVDITARGTAGPVRVGYFNFASDMSRRFLQACAGVGIPLIADFNGPQGPIGAARVMTYIDNNSERVSSETAYLTKEVLSRPNLKVALHASVTRVLFEKNGNSTRAVGVEFGSNKDAIRYQARARREVIMAAGAIHSPHLLMLSGVGPTSQLIHHSIPVVHDLPGVGQNLVDHPVVDVFFKDKFRTSAAFLRQKSLSDHFGSLKAMAQYFISRSGPLASNLGEAAAFVRSDDPVLFPVQDFSSKLEDSTSSANSPDLELFCTPLGYKDHGAVMFDMHTYALHTYLLRPTSRGMVSLKSSSPFDYPGVDPNYVQNPDDLEKLVRGIKLCLRIAQTRPFSDIVDETYDDAILDHRLHLKSDEQLRDIVRERIETVYHPTSTCRMAPREEGGVVDANLKVYGIDGLRVCDASIFPFVVSGHTAGACFATAEKLSDMIKAELSREKP